jgi:hypothetical protein
MHTQIPQPPGFKELDERGPRPWALVLSISPTSRARGAWTSLLCGGGVPTAGEEHGEL